MRNPSFFSSLRTLCSLRPLCNSLLLFFSLLFLFSCSRPANPDPSTLVFVIESNPVNLDPRFGSDAQSQRLSALLFDGLVERDAEMNLHPDLAKGSFQISYLRWVGANNDPDVFELVFNSKRIPPDGPNRGRYRSARMDALTDQIRVEMDREKRKQLCHKAQQLAADDLPYIPLWYPDVVSVHAKRLGDLPLSPTGDYQFLCAP